MNERVQNLAKKFQTSTATLTSNPLSGWDEQLDLENQSLIFKYTQGSTKHERILTFYAKAVNYTNAESHVIHGWALLLSELEKYITDNQDDSEAELAEGTLYNCFYIIQTKLKTRDLRTTLSQVIQYHACAYDLTNTFLNPCLESIFLPYITNCRTKFFNTLISSLPENPYILLFLSVVLACNVVENEGLTIEAMLDGMSDEDVDTLFELAIEIKQDTPRNFPINTGLTIQTSADEVLLSDKLFIVDCRSASNYNKAHLSTAFFLDPKTLQNNESNFKSTVEVLLEAKKMKMMKHKLKKCGFCFIGNSENDDSLNLVLSFFLREKIDRVSYVNGGFAQIAKYIQVQQFELSDWFVGSNVNIWLQEEVKSPESPEKSNNSKKSGWGWSSSLSGFGKTLTTTTPSKESVTSFFSSSSTTLTSGFNSLTNKVKEAKINENIGSAFSNIKINENLKKQVSSFAETAQEGIKSGANTFVTDITRDVKQIKQIFTQVEDDTGMIADTEKFIELETLMDDCKITKSVKKLNRMA